MGFIKSKEGFTFHQKCKAPVCITSNTGSASYCRRRFFLVKVRTEDSASLMEFMRSSLQKVPNILSTKTVIVLETVKEQQQLVLPVKKKSAKAKQAVKTK